VYLPVGTAILLIVIDKPIAAATIGTQTNNAAFCPGNAERQLKNPVSSASDALS
jgi:hypothetical protein